MGDTRRGPPADDLLAALPASPDAYVQNLDLVRGLALVVRMSEGAYRSASFLDDRILGPSTVGAWLPGTAVTAAARQAVGTRPLHFIFHTGHVGSTLVSRLIDAAGGILGLREPLPLRVAAEAQDVLGRPESLLSTPQFDALLEMLLRLWSRGYESTRAVVVKATSTAGRIAPSLLAAAPDARALYLNLRPEPYLATLLGGVNSATDLRGHGPGRVRRLLAFRELPIAPLYALATGELAALGWLVESLACRKATDAHPARVLALDFDDFMADLPSGLARVFAHFGLPADPSRVAAIVQGPVPGRYSKAPQQPFPPGERAARLAQARRDHREEIARGMAWLERMGQADERLTALLSGRAA
jgi:hypothetical protein